MAHAGGRPTVMTDKTLGKLKEAFLLDCTDEEACLFADISPSTLYEYQELNPEFSEKKKAWKQHPFLTARKTLIRAIKKSPQYALEYLKRKKKDEFSERSEHTGADGAPIEISHKVDLTGLSDADLTRLKKIYDRVTAQ